MKVGNVVLDRRQIAIIFIVVFLGAAAVFVFTYLHQVQTQQTFRVTVSNFFMPIMDTDWRVRVEQLSDEELGLVHVEIDQGTSHNGGWSFTSRDPRINERVGTEHFLSWQPSNITIVWTGGKETFLFNHYPFATLDSPSKYDDRDSRNKRSFIR